MSTIKAGTTLTLTHGCYSDYGFTGPFLVLKDFDQAIIAEEFRDQWEPSEPALPQERPSAHDFIGWLAKSQYLDDIGASSEWHVGDYDFEPDIHS